MSGILALKKKNREKKIISTPLATHFLIHSALFTQWLILYFLTWPTCRLLEFLGFVQGRQSVSLQLLDFSFFL